MYQSKLITNIYRERIIITGMRRITISFSCVENNVLCTCSPQSREMNVIFPRINVLFSKIYIYIFIYIYM